MTAPQPLQVVPNYFDGFFQSKTTSFSSSIKMSKPKGCKLFTHVKCDYNRCRGRDISAGHVADCPFQDSDEEDQLDEAEFSGAEDNNEVWNPTRHKPTQSTAGVQPLSTLSPTTQPQAAKSQQSQQSHKPWVRNISKASQRPPNTTGTRASPSIKTPSVQPKSWARAPTPPTHITICQLKGQ